MTDLHDGHTVVVCKYESAINLRKVKTNELWLEFPFAKSYLQVLETNQTSKKDAETSVKISDALLARLKENPTMSLSDAATIIGKSVRAIEMASAKLVNAGKLQNIGPQKGGHWEVVD